MGSIPVAGANRKGGHRPPFLLAPATSARNHFKLPVTASVALFWCNLISSRSEVGVQIPVARIRLHFCTITPTEKEPNGSFSVGTHNGREKPFQVACKLPRLHSLGATWSAREVSWGFRFPLGGPTEKGHRGVPFLLASLIGWKTICKLLVSKKRCFLGEACSIQPQGWIGGSIPIANILLRREPRIRVWFWLVKLHDAEFCCLTKETS